MTHFLQTIKQPILPNLQALSQQEQLITVKRKVNSNIIDNFITRVDFEYDPAVLEKIKKSILMLTQRQN